MTEDHERIEELLAGYALLSLEGEDAAEADRLLSEHVPGCTRCRRTLADFQALSGDLALTTPPVDPPDTMLPRIHRAMDEVPLEGRRPRRIALIAVAASAVALVVAMGGLSFIMGNRLNDAQTRAGTALEILSAMQSSGSQPVNVAPEGDTPPESGLVEVSAPEIRKIYVASSDCPQPAPGHAYQLWLGSNGEWVPVGPMFRPEDGVVLLEVPVDVSRFDAIWISEEVEGVPLSEPSTEWHSWSGELS